MLAHFGSTFCYMFVQSVFVFVLCHVCFVQRWITVVIFKICLYFCFAVMLCNFIFTHSKVLTRIKVNKNQKHSTTHVSRFHSRLAMEFQISICVSFCIYFLLHSKYVLSLFLCTVFCLFAWYSIPNLCFVAFCYFCFCWLGLCVCIYAFFVVMFAFQHTNSLLHCCFLLILSCFVLLRIFAIISCVYICTHTHTKKMFYFIYFGGISYFLCKHLICVFVSF